MSYWRLIRRSLCFYRRTNLSVLLAAAVGTAVLCGALVVGDSVRYSLGLMAGARLGGTELALVGADRFFRAELADELSAELAAPAAPVLRVRGLVGNDDGTRRANRIEVSGVDRRFYGLTAGNDPFGDARREAVVLNEVLAAKLGVVAGDEVVLRMAKPGVMPREIPLTPDSDLSTAFRLEVKAVADESQFGQFSLQANNVSAFNAFVPLGWLQEKLGRKAQANMLLVGKGPNAGVTVERANQSLRQHLRLGDAGLEIRRLQKQGVLELRSSRIFIDEVLAAAARGAGADSVGILSYFVNELRLGARATPYSMVSAIEPSKNGGGIVPCDMGDDEILINQWLADDLGAKEGDSVELSYFVVGPMKKLEQRKSSFRIRAILAMAGAAIDPQLMPEFPGLADVKNCRDWDPGVPIELEKIREKDEDYWAKYRGTPKAFVTLKAGQRIWANRYGNLTAVRYPLDKASSENISQAVLAEVAPASIGLYFQPVRARSVSAGEQASDFGQLFVGFSMFLIAAALVLMGLVFVFGVESRAEQIGMLLAVGLDAKWVRGVLFVEGGILAVLGAVIGTAAGLGYTRAMIYGLGTVWRVAVGGSRISFHFEPGTLFIGGAGAFAASLFAIWVSLRKQLRRPARELLAGNLQWQFLTGRRMSKGKVGFSVAVAAAVAAGIILVVMGAGESKAAAGAFFGAGALLLVAGLGLTDALLKIAAGAWTRPIGSLAGLGLRNSTRRSGRSLAVVGLLACGTFLVIAVGANRHDPMAEAARRDSGTGGFALFGESAIGILHDLNSEAGLESAGVDEVERADVGIVQLRVADGDDASCLNLNRAQRPRLLGVSPEQLRSRRAFAFAKTIGDVPAEDGWALLDRGGSDNVVPAIGDYATIVWSLGAEVGDELEYTDEKGRGFRLKLVGMLKDSILQGSLLISEDDFIERFPSEEGYRMFLIDAAEGQAETVMKGLSLGLRDFGLEVTPAVERLARFKAVENTYLSIFQMLGGLGLVLGSVGLGLVVLRNVLDRRGELAMLRAVGFAKRSLQRMVFYEHWGLLLCGLLCGSVAALLAVAPALGTSASEVPYFSLVMTIAAVAGNGIVWIWLAGAFALGTEMLDALRDE